MEHKSTNANVKASAYESKIKLYGDFEGNQDEQKMAHFVFSI
jgi:hypothetical protein